MFSNLLLTGVMSLQLFILIMGANWLIGTLLHALIPSCF